LTGQPCRTARCTCTSTSTSSTRRNSPGCGTRHRAGRDPSRWPTRCAGCSARDLSSPWVWPAPGTRATTPRRGSARTSRRRLPPRPAYAPEGASASSECRTAG
jgi:hypothetical protein